MGESLKFIGELFQNKSGVLSDTDNSRYSIVCEYHIIIIYKIRDLEAQITQFEHNNSENKL